MPFVTTPFDGLRIFEPTIYNDERGYFYESFNKKNYNELALTNEFVQDNQAYSCFGVVRGLHYQCGDAAQAKLVSVLQGAVIDVVVDLRNDSATYGKSFCIELNDTNKKQLYVPRGFAHGYSVISSHALFYYKCDNYYNKAAEAGINLLDTTLNINWQVPTNSMILSDKDKILTNFNASQKYF